MSKISRNTPCPCGSGRKYKRCCQSTAQTKAEPRADATASLDTRPANTNPGLFFEENFLDRDSNRVMSLIREGSLDEAEEAGGKLLLDYPEVHDGLERLAAVYEARGDRVRALEMYERALEFTLAHAEDYDPEFHTFYRNKIKKLKTSNVDSSDHA